MYKNEGLLLYVIAVLYFVLLRFLWSKMSNIFYERFLIYTLSLTLYLNSHYLCANVKDKRDANGSGTILIFYFCMNCIGGKKEYCSILETVAKSFWFMKERRRVSTHYECFLDAGLAQSFTLCVYVCLLLEV